MMRLLGRSLIVSTRSITAAAPSPVVDLRQDSVVVVRRELSTVGLMTGEVRWPGFLATRRRMTRTEAPGLLGSRALLCSQTRPAAASEIRRGERRRPPIEVYTTWKDEQKRKDTFGLLAALKSADDQVIQDAHTYTASETSSVLSHRAVYIHPVPSTEFVDAVEGQIMATLDKMTPQDIAALLRVYGTCEESLPLDFIEVYPSLEQHAEKLAKTFTPDALEIAWEGLNALQKRQPSVSLLQALIQHADYLVELVERNNQK